MYLGASDFWRPSVLSGGPSLDLNLMGSLDSRISFTRASTGTYFNSAGIMQTAAINAPRFDYDPVTNQPRGLLIEEARTNLILRSAELDNAIWTKVRASVTANAAISPDGTLSADKLIEDNTAAATHEVYQPVTVAAASTVSCSVFAKAGERSEFAFRCVDPAFIGRAFFNLATGTLGVRDAAVASSSIIPVGDGWYRCSATFVTGGTGTTPYVNLQIVNGSVTYSGDGTSGFYVWGAQIEVGAFPTSYIPTAGTTVTRAADVATMPVGSWFNGSAGTLTAEVTPMAPATFATNQYLVALSDGSTNNRYSIFRNLSSNDIAYRAVAGGVASNPGATSGAAVAGSVVRAALSYSSGAASATAQGGIVSTSAPALATGLTQLSLGVSEAASSAFLNGHIRRVRYWPTCKSNADLQGLTS